MKWLYFSQLHAGKEYSMGSYLNSLAASGNTPEPLNSTQSRICRFKGWVTEDVTLAQSAEAQTRRTRWVRRGSGQR